jgi:hypothetical protein
MLRFLCSGRWRPAFARYGPARFLLLRLPPALPPGGNAFPPTAFMAVFAFI